MKTPLLRLLTAGLLALAPLARAADEPDALAMRTHAAKGLPSEPAWGFWPDVPAAWLQTHQSFVERSRRGGVDVVFLGDSITKGWKQAETENWAGRGPAPRVANYAIGGDSTRQLLWRIDHGVLDNIRPRLLVLMIGTNNLYQDHNSGTNEEIAAGVRAVLARIRAKLPETRVLLLGVLPRQTRGWTGRIEKLNTLLASFAEPGRVECHDVGGVFVDERGLLEAGLYMPDRVHLSPAGYDALTTAVKPLVRGLFAP